MPQISRERETRRRYLTLEISRVLFFRLHYIICTFLKLAPKGNTTVGPCTILCYTSCVPALGEKRYNQKLAHKLLAKKCDKKNFFSGKEVHRIENQRKKRASDNTTLWKHSLSFFLFLRKRTRTQNSHFYTPRDPCFVHSKSCARRIRAQQKNKHREKNKCPIDLSVSSLFSFFFIHFR